MLFIVAYKITDPPLTKCNIVLDFFDPTITDSVHIGFMFVDPFCEHIEENLSEDEVSTLEKIANKPLTFTHNQV